jgi:hypothetical protein
MLFERHHPDPEIRHALERARVLRAQYLRQLFSRKGREPKKSSATSFILLHFFRHPRPALNVRRAAASQNS